MNDNRMRVLIVDDETAPLKLLETSAAMAGLAPTCATDAAQAMEAHTLDPFPVIFLDWMMPGTTGLELCSTIRKAADGAWPVVVIVTAKETPVDLKEALAAGADDYMTKSAMNIETLRIRFTIASNIAEERQKRRMTEQALARAHVTLEKRFDDLCLALNLLRIGAILLDKLGNIRFFSKGAEGLLGVRSEHALGKSWKMALNSEDPGKQELEKALEAGEQARYKIPMKIETMAGPGRWIEVEVKDDPRGDDKKILFLYDVSDIHNLRRQLEKESKFFGMLGKSPAMDELKRQIQEFAQINWTVMIEGETGAGKELIARAIHFSSPRKDKPFVAVNTAGLSDSLLASQLFGHRKGSFTGATEDHIGLFESAHGGTLFLDEIGDISPAVQVSLLRALEQGCIIRVGESHERKINVRFLAATHKDLAEEARAGRMRQDLLFRIRGARITAPPLRARREDIELLARHFLSVAKAATGKGVEGFAQETVEAMMEYYWPGNVRELKSAVEYSLIRCRGQQILKQDLPPEITGAAPLGKPSGPPPPREMSIEEAMRQSRGNRSKAAKLLGISRSTLYRRIEEEEDAQ